MLLGRLSQAVLQRLLELLQHRFLDHDVLVIQVVDYVLVAALGVDVDDDGLDRRVALDQDTCRGRWTDVGFISFPSSRKGQEGPGMLTSDSACWHDYDLSIATGKVLVWSRYSSVVAHVSYGGFRIWKIGHASVMTAKLSLTRLNPL